MKKNREHILRDNSIDKHASERLPGEQMDSVSFGSTQAFPEDSMCPDHTASEILKIYLQGLKHCTKKKRRRCISQELGR